MQIFISYSRVDKPFVADLARRIARMFPNSRLWWDRELTGGDDWWREILEQIAASDIFIFVMSNDSIASDYCRREFRYARQTGRKILPVLARDRTPIPPALAKLHYVNMINGASDADALVELSAALNRLQPAASAAPAPAAEPDFGLNDDDWPPAASADPPSVSGTQTGSGNVQQNIGSMTGGTVSGQQNTFASGDITDSVVVSGVQNSTVHIGSAAQEREARRRDLLRQKRALEDRLYDIEQMAKVHARPSPLRPLGLLVGAGGVLGGLALLLLSEGDTIGLVIAAAALLLAFGLYRAGSSASQPSAGADLRRQIAALEDEINRFG